MSVTAVETTMSALAAISFVASMIIFAIWLLAFGSRLAGKRAPFLSAATAGVRHARADQLFRELALDPYVFFFDRSLPAAAAEAGTKRAVRQSVASADGVVSINLTSPSRREVEISLSAANQSPGTIAVVHVTDEYSDRRVLIPLAVSSSGSATPGQSAGVTLVPTTARRVSISRDVKLIQLGDLGTYAEDDIGQSVRAAAGPTRRWWQELLDAAEAGRVILPERALAAIVAAITKGSSADESRRS